MIIVFVKNLLRTNIFFYLQLMESVHHTHSCTVTIQDGEDAGQTVRHLHCHIMPRRKGDFIENDHIYLELAKNDQLVWKLLPNLTSYLL